MRIETSRLASLLPVALLLGCSPTSTEIVFELQAHSFRNAEWSAPANLGPLINTTNAEASATLSPDGLSLYFSSDRPGGSGGTDIWVSHRACAACLWTVPVNVGVLNSAAAESAPSLSVDGHLLFLLSGRPGGQGANDIYLSHRVDKNDDLTWSTPTALGADVNSADVEAGPEYLQSGEDGSANLYFVRGPGGANRDIYYVSLGRDGETRGPAILVSHLNHPTAGDAGPSLRGDGREIFFHSNRPGGLGGNDIWTSTRRSIHDPWSIPVNLGELVNRDIDDATPSLSADGRTLLFDSVRPGGIGGRDIWMVTRTPSGK